MDDARRAERNEGEPWREERAAWLGLLARARPEALAEAWSRLDVEPTYSWLRRPEVGLALIRGRMGGDGRPFNLGEMTMTRCALVVEGTLGVGYVAGRDRSHAERVALCDALLQRDGTRERLLREVVEPLSAAERARDAAAGRRAAATRVDFFTMARGDNPG